MPCEVTLIKRNAMLHVKRKDPCTSQAIKNSKMEFQAEVKSPQHVKVITHTQSVCA